ncbi:MAG: hypothetical protein KDE59_23350 [Anaerolineales bacterium]|nr:hypothetical protein [Anaerolineales bacterium]
MSRSALSLALILLLPILLLLGGLRWLAGGVLAQAPLLEESSALAAADWEEFPERPGFYQVISSEPGWVLGSYAYPVEADAKGGLLLGQWVDGAWG